MRGILHPITDADLNAYVDGEVTPDRREEIEAFLIADPTQAVRVETWRRQNEIIRAAFAKVASEPLPSSYALVLSPPTAIRTERIPRRPAAPLAPEEQNGGEIRPLRLSRREQNSRTMGMAFAAFAAGALLTTVAAELSGVASNLLPQSSAGRVTPVLASPPPSDTGKLFASRAIEAYRTYALDMVRPIEIEASREAFLASWLSQRVGLTIDVPDLSSEGLKLLGGRLTPGEWGPAAFLLYETTGGDRISLFIGRAATHESQGLSYSEEHSARALWWIDSGAAYALTGSASPDKLMRVARFLIGKNRPGTAP